MPQKIKMPQRPANQRNKDFEEVTTGYTEKDAVTEAVRCIQCKAPQCVKGCPVNIDIPGFIKHIAGKNYEQSIKVLKDKNNLPAVCGRVCPQENQCEKMCILGKKGDPIGIGYLERFASDWASENLDIVKPEILSNNIKIAVIGSGPAGLTCAGDLAKAGYDVTVFESLHDTGGVLRYGIPEFRLPILVLDKEIDFLKSLGIKFVLNCLIGRTKSVEDLWNEGFKAIFAGTGAGLPVFLNVEGENLNHIYSANEFLVRVNLMRSFAFPEYDTPIYKGKKVVVVGGGNTAMDSARTALRLGAESVKLVYRRTENEMPARVEERHHAAEEGVEFVTLTNPIRFLGDEKGFVKAVECVKMELTEPDESGRRKPVKVANSNFIIETDLVVLALGLNPNPILPALTKGLETDSHGYIIVDDNLMTRVPGIFAGGDIVGGDTVIQAMGMGKKAAKSIENYLKNNP
ncbi:MAG: NADPH-dependent glutamate synthase [Endomicrobia bacterium]|nr:NADPH-dependent glutamate synthase [Endomicrobiia bacterium]MCL2506431.1 NADPH-dependent glutamate synthase [Endomicrobiia bacterium]